MMELIIIQFYLDSLAGLTIMEPESSLFTAFKAPGAACGYFYQSSRIVQYFNINRAAEQIKICFENGADLDYFRKKSHLTVRGGGTGGSAESHGKRLLDWVLHIHHCTMHNFTAANQFQEEQAHIKVR